jgi:hypothetical protein
LPLFVLANEAQTLNLVDQTLATTTLPNIQAAHDSDVMLLEMDVQAVRDCDKDLKQTAEIDAAKGVLDTSRTALAACRSEEAKLLGFQVEELKKLTNFVSATSAGPGDELGCDLPLPTQLDDEEDAMDQFFASSEEWYATKQATLKTLVDNNNKAIAAHKAQAAICNDDKQPDFEAKYCAWSALILAKRDDYVKCRTDTKKSLDDSFAAVTVKSGHRKSDFTAVNRVRCLLKVLMHEGSGDDVDAELNKCLDEVIETDQFTIAKPEYPPSDEASVNALGDLSGNEVECTQEKKE